MALSLKNRFFFISERPIKHPFLLIMNFMTLTISKVLSFWRTLSHTSIRLINAVHIVRPELYEYSASVMCVRSSACVYALICESVMNSACVHTKKAFEGILLVKTNPPSMKAGYGPARSM